MSLVSDLKKKGVDPAVNVSAYRVDTTPKSTNSNSASKSSGSKLVQDLQGSGVRPAVEIYKEEEERRAKEYAQRVKDTEAQNNWEDKKAEEKADL